MTDFRTTLDQRQRQAQHKGVTTMPTVRQVIDAYLPQVKQEFVHLTYDRKARLLASFAAAYGTFHVEELKPEDLRVWLLKKRS